MAKQSAEDSFLGVGRRMLRSTLNRRFEVVQKPSEGRGHIWHTLEAPNLSVGVLWGCGSVGVWGDSGGVWANAAVAPSICPFPPFPTCCPPPPKSDWGGGRRHAAFFFYRETLSGFLASWIQGSIFKSLRGQTWVGGAYFFTNNSPVAMSSGYSLDVDKVRTKMFKRWCQR